MLTSPQFYAPWELSDIELAGLISIERTPRTPEGEHIANEIVRVCEDKGSEKSPCEFLTYRGPLFGRTVEVRVIEPEQNTHLCGPAYLNEIVVFEGSILGIPRKEEWKKAFEEGVPTNIRFLDAFAAQAASKLEEVAETGEIDRNDCEIKVKIVRSGADINIKIDDVAMRYITSTKKKIDIRGPVFSTVVAKKVS
jgi:O-phosphoseryl-tRNA synthetase